MPAESHLLRCPLVPGQEEGPQLASRSVSERRPFEQPGEGSVAVDRGWESRDSGGVAGRRRERGRGGL